ADGKLLQKLGETDLTRLRAFGWVPPKEVVVKAADGKTDLWVTMYFPRDFDPNRKYPLVEYIYGGPQTTQRQASFPVPQPGTERSANFDQALAQLGFVVVRLDGRGTPERSKAFHDVIYLNWGRNEIADHAGAIRQLAKKFSFIDLDHVGIYGTS